MREMPSRIQFSGKKGEKRGYHSVNPMHKRKIFPNFMHSTGQHWPQSERLRTQINNTNNTLALLIVNDLNNFVYCRFIPFILSL